MKYKILLMTLSVIVVISLALYSIHRQHHTLVNNQPWCVQGAACEYNSGCGTFTGSGSKIQCSHTCTCTNSHTLQCEDNCN